MGSGLLQNNMHLKEKPNCGWYTRGPSNVENILRKTDVTM
jgi:hypothetical protein